MKVSSEEQGENEIKKNHRSSSNNSNETLTLPPKFKLEDKY